MIKANDYLLYRQKMKRELYNRNLKANIRAISSDDNTMKIEGILPYNKISEELYDPEYGKFREVITPTAFKRTISIPGNDIKALYSHQRDKVLGRTTNNTLRLTDTPEGLVCSVVLPDTDYARNTYSLIKGGYVDQMSFGFNIIDQDIKREGNKQTNYLKEVALDEISFCVTDPAYSDTIAHTRNIKVMNKDFDFEKLETILRKEKEDLTKRDSAALLGYIAMLQDLIDDDDASGTTEGGPGDATPELTDKPEEALLGFLQMVAKAFSK